MVVVNDWFRSRNLSVSHHLLCQFTEGREIKTDAVKEGLLHVHSFSLILKKVLIHVQIRTFNIACSSYFLLDAVSFCTSYFSGFACCWVVVFFTGLKQLILGLVSWYIYVCCINFGRKSFRKLMVGLGAFAEVERLSTGVCTSGWVPRGRVPGTQKLPPPPPPSGGSPGLSNVASCSA